MGAIVNSAVIIIASLIGLVIGQRIPERFNTSIMQGIGLVVLTIGISGAIKGEDTLVLILSMVFGIIIGEMLKIDYRVNRLVNQLTTRMKHQENNNQISEAFLTATMLFCIGSLAIIGSLESGLTGDNSMLYMKSVLDGISSLLFSSTLGIGVMLSSVPVLIYQGGLILFAQLLAPLLNDAVILEMTTVGSVLLIGMGLNMLGITEFKIMNFVPAIFIPIIILSFL